MTEINNQKIKRAKFWDYFILVVRIWLAWTLIKYGYSKLIGGQLNVTEATLELPVKEVDLFRLSFYLMGHEPFNSFVGISQILIGILLVFNRTHILGAFMSIPIWLNILIFDMTFMGLYTGFTIRIPYYLFLTCMIIWHQKDKVLPALKSLITGISTKFKFPIWTYLLIIPLGFIVELIGGIPIVIIYYIKELFQ